MMSSSPRMESVAGPSIQIADPFPTANVQMLRQQKAQNVEINQSILSQAGLHSVSSSEGAPNFNTSFLSHSLPIAETAPHIPRILGSLQETRRVPLPPDSASLQMMRSSQCVLGPTVNTSMQNQHNSLFPAISRMLSAQNTVAMPPFVYNTPLNSMSQGPPTAPQSQINLVNQNQNHTTKVKSLDLRDEDCLLQDDYFKTNVRRVTNDEI
mmetsp:Transcript_12482/g.27557  ORF Transcript_12482/g.27557 Transcript_12482/m.27557 type:complete len:210 (+) Transcript_12482:585-1214(+)